MNFQGILVARNYHAPSTIFANKKGLLCVVSQKKIKGRHFVGNCGTFCGTISFDNLLKNMLKISILNLRKRGHFFKFCVSITFWYDKV